MKKYSVIFLVLIIASVFALSACNKSATASNHFANYEKYTYDVYDVSGESEVKVGTMTMSVSLAFREKIDWDGAVSAEYGSDSFDGFKVRYELSLDNGDFVNSLAYFKNDAAFNPLASHKTSSIHVDGAVKTQDVYSRFDYSKRNVQFYYFENGEEKSVKCGRSKIADNQSLYTMLRTYDMSANMSLTYVVPDVENQSSRSISISKGTNGTVTSSFEGVKKDYDCYRVTFSLNDKLTGISYVVYYAINDITFNNTTLVRVPLLIHEGSIQYRLSSIEAATK